MERKFLFVFIALSIFLFAINLSNKKIDSKQNNMTIENRSLLDTVAKQKMAQNYLKGLLMKTYSLNNTYLKHLDVYDITSGGTKKQISDFNKGREKFVIRYSTIGCNTCIDLIFKRKDRIQAIEKKYDLIIFVDFEKYDEFVKWKRISEIEGKIYWIAAGKLPFDKIFEGQSYTFILNKSMMARSFFAPYNLFPEYLHDYLKKVVNLKEVDNAL